jgi:hypothetical protein
MIIGLTHIDDDEFDDYITGGDDLFEGDGVSDHDDDW